MTSRFETRKQSILAQLEAPDGDYHDLSPKGSVDEPIRDLISEINSFYGLVTTSSCSGRISVFLEGRKANTGDSCSEEQTESRAGPGGKGGGGAWLYISHDPVKGTDVTTASTYTSLFGLQDAASEDDRLASVKSRYIHLKFEPMILHILTASIQHAQRVLTAALSAGFRESGAVSLGASKLTDPTPIVAVRSTGYSFDSIVGHQISTDQNIALVDEHYLKIMVAVANDRFRINAERIARFRAALTEIFQPTLDGANSLKKKDWEDADARRQRKREEGLARQQAMQAEAADGPDPTHDDEIGLKLDSQVQ
ncbi:methyltransferase TYW3-domain-containing protein [Paraphoma chrysanthemicola]|nr:methyltransferase TYW3-domain-containing protein [Paraphoma chrysanthemicola]